jgi:hypothetical protein
VNAATPSARLPFKSNSSKKMRLASGSDSVALKATSGVVSLNWKLYERGNFGGVWPSPLVTRVTPLALVIARS